VRQQQEMDQLEEMQQGFIRYQEAPAHHPMADPLLPVYIYHHEVQQQTETDLPVEMQLVCIFCQDKQTRLELDHQIPMNLERYLFLLTLQQMDLALQADCTLHQEARHLMVHLAIRHLGFTYLQELQVIPQMDRLVRQRCELYQEMGQILRMEILHLMV
jgi:predicted component of type VI protein secretion system